MDFNFTEDQEMLSTSVRQFVRKESPVDRLRTMREDPIGWDKKMWKRMGEQGWLGILYDEEVGGFGGSFVDLMAVLEPFGTNLVPEPVIASAVLGGLPLHLLGTAQQKETYLQSMVAGDTSLAFAHAEDTSRFSPEWIACAAESDGTGWKLSGKKVFVPNGHAADHIVVAARTGGKPGEAEGLTLFIVSPSDPGVDVRTVQGMDGQKYGQITFQNAAVAKEALLGEVGKAFPVMEQVLDYGAAAAVCEGLGATVQMLSMTVEYLLTRKQFGVFIGSFQALQHVAVDMFVETELCRSAAILAAIDVDSADAEVRKASISTAKAQLADSGKYVSQQATQLHGGIGVTDEHDLGLYFKRMHVLNTLFGDERYHIERFAALPSFAGEDALTT